MAIINRNDFGLIAINDDLLRKLVLNELKYNTQIVLCNKKGNIVKKTFLGGPEGIKNAVVIKDMKGALNINIYILCYRYELINDIVDSIFNSIAELFNQLCIVRPCNFNFVIKGIIASDNTVEELNIEISRHYEQNN